MQGIGLAWVAIASPGDVAAERDAVEDAIYEWDQQYSGEKGIAFLSLRWERDAIPVVGGGDAQHIINQEVINRSDVVIAFFGDRLGTATRSSLSGTVEEIEKAQARGILPHVFFSSKAIPRDHDISQFQVLEDYRRKLQSEGLLAEYATRSKLKKLVHACLSKEALMLASKTARMQHFGPGVSVRFDPKVDSQGKLIGLVVKNVGMEDLTGLSLLSVELDGHALRSGTLRKKLTIKRDHSVNVTLAPNRIGREIVLVFSNNVRGRYVQDSLLLLI